MIHSSCHFGNSQMFRFTKDPVRNRWEIKPETANTYCVDVFDNVGPDLFRHPCHLGNNQAWALDGDFWVSYLNNHVLDASGTDTRALNWPYNGAANQRWTIVPQNSPLVLQR
ncbi:RICIN domain-containing protein [Lentzea sp. NBRC 102530]|uniref:RICIN domain-containing protein n=1 Tax=Lentzea sp. NBRC 102530 TaxID=3032201 RepID=UPI00332C185F